MCPNNTTTSPLIFAAALDHSQHARTDLPHDAAVHLDVAKALEEMGKTDDAEAAYRRSIELSPSPLAAYCQLAKLLTGAGRHEDAITAYECAMLLEADEASIHNDLGNALQKAGRPEEALAAYRRMLLLDPHDALAESNIGSVLQAQGKIELAMRHYNTALALAPEFATAHFNMGNCKLLSEKIDEAIVHFSDAIRHDPNFYLAHINLTTTLSKAGRIDEATLACRRAIEINPQWNEMHSNLLFSLTHDAAVTPADLFEEHLRFGRQFETPLQSAWPQHDNNRDPDRVLRVGFVSADLNNHALANFITPVLEHLVHATGLELYVYCNNRTDDRTTDHLRGIVSRWQAIQALSDQQLVRQIASDGIDILIDLSGHTGSNRLLAFARKPAPLQLSWMGYPMTTGLQAMDYFLTDRYLSPASLLDDQFTEKFLALPASGPYVPSPDAPAIATAPALEHSYITFGSFNRANKLSREVIAGWSALLRAIPQARMVVAAMPSEQFREMLLCWFQEEGITGERLSFRAITGTREYLAMHQLVDVCIDTWPYNGGTTTFHALWMGVPTLTIAGNTLLSRVGSTIMGYLGLEQFIARDLADFIQKGQDLAKDLDALAKLRMSMRTLLANSPAGQPALIAAGLDNALRTIWQRWCAGLPAESFEADPSLSSLAKRATSMQALHAINIDAALPLAIEHHQAGRFVEAETLYLAILHRQAHHAIANHNMGLLAAQLGLHDDALPYLRSALEAAPGESQFHLSYAKGLLQAGLPAEALRVADEAIARGVDSSELQAMLQRTHATIITSEQIADTQQGDEHDPISIPLAADSAKSARDADAGDATASAIYMPNVNISTEDDFVGVSDAHPLAKQFLVLEYEDGALTTIPHRFFRNWLDEEAQGGSFYIGRCSGFGVGSLVKYDAGAQSLCVGRYVAGGLRLRFLLNGQHETRTISTYMFCGQGMGLRNAPPPQYADSIIKNDVWIGDEAMMLGGGIIENGCIIGARSVLPPNFRSEPYGVYVGAPARLVRYRFSEQVRAALLDLAWWEMPLSWVRENNDFFLLDMTADDQQVLPVIASLRANRDKFLAGLPKHII